MAGSKVKEIENSLEIRQMTAADTQYVAVLEKQSFSLPWSKQSLDMELQNKCAHFFVAIENDELLGYIGMHAVLDEGYVANVAVDPAHRRKGVGSALLEVLLEECEVQLMGFLTLEVRESNIAAIALYKKYQFGVVGRRKQYYSSPNEDALLMTRFFGKVKETEQ